jgi:threonine/homoserine/homoserine lactone efflux protein
MFGIQHYPSFILAILLFQLVPGPGTMAILGATARGGIRAGLGAVLGTLAGDFLYMLAAVLGLAALLAAYPVAFAVIRWAGIGYLIWIGIGLARAQDPADAPREVQALPGWVHFRRAFAVALTNPKVILFFMAFFPLFLRADARPATLGLMMAQVTVLSGLYQTGLVLVGNQVAKRLGRIRRVRVLSTRLAGLAMIGFGLRLALGRR